jgi:hypothetical protein
VSGVVTATTFTLGSGTAFTKFEGGIASVTETIAGGGGTASTLITFPSAFAATPKVSACITFAGSIPTNGNLLIVSPNGASTTTVSMTVTNIAVTSFTGTFEIEWFAFTP